ncbi:MAG: isoprenylcysteine carboxylmethyltransferase family protein [Chloroflexi bacterium]|nr:isoprenylcysteine carboxylmethyltransferase family protein [Chloroflexota bacterium]
MSNKTTTAKSVITSLVRLVAGIVVIGACLFWPAGTFNYWQAWAWLGTLFLPMGVSLVYLVRRDPALLERRTRTSETRPEQRLIIAASSIYFLVIFLLPGFDKRYGWSQVPVWLVILADLGVLAGYGLYILVLRTNSYASRVIEVEQGQQVISAGPYALVRHPMYLGMILLMVATPLALGSFWAFLPSLGLIPLLVVRARDEEKLLMKDLAGYREYTQKTHYRIFPGIW